ncbi:hypothetical protein [Mariprofundus ferrooxydans]|uniref:hypothetical protein n=1 Tax=Mariprofundus ferrooxydans TaxID=314344 RepID=UPI0014317BAE|nr:hypothetical protein [Mariprofundus ferrooxydans]
MIRNLFLALFFFFGPALLMFMLRNIILLLRIWLVVRNQRNQQQDVIDITPVERNRAPRWFYLVAAVLGVASAVAGFMYLQTVDSERRVYVPAHMGQQGEIVPGHWQSLPPAPK